MATIEFQGTTFAIGDGASPETFNQVAEVLSIQDLGSGTATVIDVSNASSERREKRMGLPDEGQVRIELNWDPNDTDGQGAMATARANRTETNFRVTFSEGGSPLPTDTFAGFVLQFGKSGAVDEVWRRTAVIEITGAITEA